MTDYELAYLFSEASGGIAQLVMNYISIVFAFIVAAAIAAQRMSRNLSIIAISIFCVYAILVIFQINRSAANMIALAGRIKDAAKTDSADLNWHASAEVPDFILSGAPTLITMLTLLAMFGALYFFYLCRRGEFGARL